MPTELGRKIPHDILIEPSDNMGFIVKIGCGKFVAESAEMMIAGIIKYLDDPELWVKRYNERPGRGNEVIQEERTPRPETQLNEGADGGG